MLPDPGIEVLGGREPPGNGTRRVQCKIKLSKFGKSVTSEKYTASFFALPEASRLPGPDDLYGGVG